jgi:hypothetical protein
MMSIAVRLYTASQSTRANVGHYAISYLKLDCETIIGIDTL